MEYLIMAGFAAALLFCVVCGHSILYALAWGLLLFLGYGRYKGFGWAALLGMAGRGIKTVRNILIVFMLIGLLTALWRAGGTIPTLVGAAAGLVSPGVFYLLTFLLNCLLSVLTGTSFGTAATMGVICMTMANAMQLNPVLVGGAVLSGIYFGDRCSPVSTSALLVAELTKTDIFSNIAAMLRTSLLPLGLTAAIYAVMGLGVEAAAINLDMQAVFAEHFVWHWFNLLPAIAIFLLAVCRVDVKWSMLVSILLALGGALFVQGVPPERLGGLLLWGYQGATPQIAALLDGGGIVSMLQVAAIVCLSSTYAEIFEQTGLLRGAEKLLLRIGRRSCSFTAVLVAAVVTCAVACNQTLAIMLTQQLCAKVEPRPQALALALENTCVVIAPLIPWSIAGAVPLAAIGAPTASILAACFLYVLPLIRLIINNLKKRGI